MGSVQLCHVLSIRISDEAAIDDKKIQGRSLPRRKMTGKAGRTVQVGCWTTSQADVDAGTRRWDRADIHSAEQ